MTVIDKRGKKLDTCFGELVIGDAFQGTDDRIYLKVGYEHAIRYNDSLNVETWSFVPYDYAELIIPLKATLTIERGE